MHQPDQPREPKAQSAPSRGPDVCERFERAWQAGLTPRLEDYLAEAPADNRDALLGELLRLELSYRAAQGCAATHEEYQARFPAHAERVASAFDDARFPGAKPWAAEPASRAPGEADTVIPTLAGDAPQTADEAPPPPRIGRYAVRRLLGRGGFGAVWLADDEELRRPVAIKVPRRDRVSSPATVSEFLREARTAAALRHPGIVTIFDVGRRHEGDCYVVMEYVEGLSLAERLRTGRPGFDEAVEWMVYVAEAVHYAHKQGLVHRDLKPANILLDAAGRPYVADFGLALREEDFGRSWRDAGTPAYMSPEQARGEGHLVDARSDIYSLGVVLYELLVGRRPYRRASVPELLAEIASAEVRPPRQLDDSVPKELDRICLKALAKRVADRYSTAADLADDLRHLKGTGGEAGSGEQGKRRRGEEKTHPQTAIRNPQFHHNPQSAIRNPQSTPVVPKGLRSFDAHDADFFLQLLPGPRDRDGLPEALRFWKTLIDETEAERTFRVGLIYGPSGCGKSSFVKAGLLPRLEGHVHAIYLEAASDDTEPRLARLVRRSFPELPHGPLVELLAAFRRGAGPPGSKLLLVLDQFEQWLHARLDDPAAELVRALRQCDGGRLQCLALVRDDFWMAATRFMRELDQRLVERQNSAAVDLFDPFHARRVLFDFGRAYGRVGQAFQPDAVPHADAGALASQAGRPKAPPTAEQDGFLTQAVIGLTRDGKVSPVRLALFAEMVKGKPWIPATLRALGGIEGVGVAFLEEAFSASTAPPAHRLHQQAARAVLAALLPESGSDIKGHKRSRDELLSASGYANRPAEFDELMRILDGDLRLVTPADEDAEVRNAERGTRSDAEQSSGAEAASRAPHSALPAPRSYQLTHDYLVPSLREWLTRQRRRTRRGRAELRLAERSAEWNARPGRRHLPNWWEWLGIRAWTRRHDWSEPQRRCMRAAGRFHVTRSLVLLIVAGLASWGAWEVNGQVEARALRERLLLARTADVPALVPAIDRRRRFIGPLLRAALDDPNLDPKQRMHASLALLPADPRQAAYLAERLLESTPHELPVLRDAIGPDRPEVTQTLWTVASNPHETADRRLRAACALADFTPDDARWDQVAGDVVGALLARGPRDFDAWLDLLRCVRGQLAEPFRSVYLGTGGGQPADRSLALSALLDDPDQIGGQIVDLVRGADAEQLALLVPTLKRNREQAISRLRSALGEPLAPPHAAVGSAAAASVLPAEIRARIERADGMLTDAFAFCQTLPLAELDNLLAQLNESPYQVTRVRPYRADGKRLAAVCWLNDGVQRRAAVGMSADELSDQDRSRREEGWICDDVAGYLYEEGGANAAGVRYACVWRRRVADHDDARLVLGVADPKKDDERLKKDGFAYRGLSQWRGNDGGARYAVLWCKPSPTWNASWDLRDSVYRAKASLGWRQTDLSVRATAALGERPRTPEERLARAERAVERDPTDNKAKLDLAQAKLELGQFEEANSAVQSVVIDAYRASVGGGKFDEDAAMRAFLLYFSGNAGDLQTGAPREMLNLIQSKFNSLMAFADAYGGAEQPLSRLEIAVRSRPFDADLLCQAAAACSMASMTVRHTQGERAAGLNDRAMELLTQAIAAGFDDFARLAQNPDFDPLRGDDRFARILAEGAGPAVYAGVWWFDPEWISTELHGLSPQEHLRRCRELADSGYRPVVVALGEPSSGQPALAASAWERPAISNQLKEQFAKCRANVATALVALGRTEDVEPLLRHGDDPRLRTYLLERLATIEPRPALLADAVSAGEMDAAQRAGLLLALGQSRSATSKSAPGGDALKAALLKRYRTDPDPGVHGAAEWLLRRLACEDEINQAEEQFAGSGWTAGRRWYVNAQRQTLAIITGPVQFLMGAPGSEVNRGEDEPQHLRRIERTFAIGVKEVTMEQFRRFRADAGDSVAPEPNCPAMRLSWHDAAAYCNWLSGQEGIPQVDWCYEPVAIGANTLQAKSDALLRTGYRLPTEAEWECACRAGTQTSRHFGEADTLLDGYDWFKENTQSLRTMPVARLKPNELGLFDLYGNAVEWCHSKYDPYVVPRDGTPVLDFDDWDPVSANRVMRGGALGDNPSEMRSARRRSVAADSKTGPHGLRVARTITPPRPRRRP